MPRGRGHSGVVVPEAADKSRPKHPGLPPHVRVSLSALITLAPDPLKLLISLTWLCYMRKRDKLGKEPWNFLETSVELWRKIARTSGFRRDKCLKLVATLRRGGFLQGTAAQGFTVTGWTALYGLFPEESRRNPGEFPDREKAVATYEKPPDPPDKLGGERRAAENSADGNGGHEQRPESKALWKLVKHWGPLPSHMCSLTAEASETTVAYALDAQLNATIREHWGYLWACMHPKKTKRNPEGKRKPPPDATMRKAKKRIDAERVIPVPLGAAAAALAERMGKA